MQLGTKLLASVVVVTVAVAYSVYRTQTDLEDGNDAAYRATTSSETG